MVPCTCCEVSERSQKRKVQSQHPLNPLVPKIRALKSRNVTPKRYILCFYCLFVIHVYFLLFILGEPRRRLFCRFPEARTATTTSLIWRNQVLSFSIRSVFGSSYLFWVLARVDSTRLFSTSSSFTGLCFKRSCIFPDNQGYFANQQ